MCKRASDWIEYSQSRTCPVQTQAAGLSFLETVQLAKRWTGTAANAAGFVEQACDIETLVVAAQERAAQLAPLAANRKNYGGQKQRLFGENAAINEVHGAAYMLANPSLYSH